MEYLKFKYYFISNLKLYKNKTFFIDVKSYNHNHKNADSLIIIRKKLLLLYLKPTHCTITYFGFRARQIDGVECGLFSIHAPLGQTTLRIG